MSGSLPTSPALRSVNIKHNTPNIVTFAVSGRRQVKSSSAQFFSFECSYAPMKRADAAPIFAFLTAQKGQFETFTVTLPEYSNTQTGYSGSTPSVVNTQTAGDASIEFDGASTSTALVKAGDFVKFSGHNKVYMVTADVTTSGSGTGTIAITPQLQQQVANDETITVNNVPFTVFLEDEQQEYSTGLADMVGIEFSVREAL
jgi:hypothetical protein